MVRACTPVKLSDAVRALGAAGGEMFDIESESVFDAEQAGVLATCAAEIIAGLRGNVAVRVASWTKEEIPCVIVF